VAIKENNGGYPAKDTVLQNRLRGCQ